MRKWISPVWDGPHWWGQGFGLAAVASARRGAPVSSGEVFHGAGHGPAVGRRSGVTLIEMLIVVAIIAVVAGISYPSVSTGLDSIRLKSAADSVSGFLSAAITRVERRQQPIEVVISPHERALILYSTEPGYTKRLELPQGIQIVGEDARQYLLLPGAAPPQMGIDLFSPRGAHRLVKIDPVTGAASS